MNSVHLFQIFLWSNSFSWCYESKSIFKSQIYSLYVEKVKIITFVKVFQSLSMLSLFCGLCEGVGHVHAGAKRLLVAGVVSARPVQHMSYPNLPALPCTCCTYATALCARLLLALFFANFFIRAGSFVSGTSLLCIL